MMRAIASLLILATVPLMAAGVSMAPESPAHTAMTDDGEILVTPAGMSLYVYGPDASTPGKSRCTNVPVRGFPDPTAGFGTYPVPRADVQKSCAQRFPPFLAAADASPHGDWSMIERPEGGRQWTFRGRPLYTSIKDHLPGERNGAFRIGQLAVGGRGWNVALAPLNFPPGLGLVRREEGLVLATANGTPVYTPGGAHSRTACSGCGELFQPIAAPAVASVDGDWSIVGAGAGRRQYAYRGLPLYVPAQQMLEDNLAESSGWQTVVYHKSAGMPPQIGRHLTLVGDVFTDKSGHTLYAFTCGSPAGDGTRCDDPGDAAGYWVGLCGDARECARRWRPYLAMADARPVGDWSIAEVAYPMFTDPTGFTYPPEAPRVKAWAYRGMPVYTYYEDQAPGDIWGHYVRWFALSGFYAVQVPGRSMYD